MRATLNVTKLYETQQVQTNEAWGARNVCDEAAPSGVGPGARSRSRLGQRPLHRHARVAGKRPGDDLSAL